MKRRRQQGLKPPCAYKWRGSAEHCGWCGGGLATLFPGAARGSRRARAAQGAETGWWVQWVWFWEGSGASSCLVGMEMCLSRNLKLWEEKGGHEYKTYERRVVSDVQLQGDGFFQ